MFANLSTSCTTLSHIFLSIELSIYQVLILSSTNHTCADAHSFTSAMQDIKQYFAKGLCCQPTAITKQYNVCMAPFLLWVVRLYSWMRVEFLPPDSLPIVWWHCSHGTLMSTWWDEHHFPTPGDDLHYTASSLLPTTRWKSAKLHFCTGVGSSSRLWCSGSTHGLLLWAASDSTVPLLLRGAQGDCLQVWNNRIASYQDILSLAFVVWSINVG